jgi:hypothetical protein
MIDSGLNRLSLSSRSFTWTSCTYLNSQSYLARTLGVPGHVRKLSSRSFEASHLKAVGVVMLKTSVDWAIINRLIFT